MHMVCTYVHHESSSRLCHLSKWLWRQLLQPCFCCLPGLLLVPRHLPVLCSVVWPLPAAACQGKGLGAIFELPCLWLIRYLLAISLCGKLKVTTPSVLPVYLCILPPLSVQVSRQLAVYVEGKLIGVHAGTMEVGDREKGSQALKLQYHHQYIIMEHKEHTVVCGDGCCCPP